MCEYLYILASPIALICSDPKAIKFPNIALSIGLLTNNQLESLAKIHNSNY